MAISNEPDSAARAPSSAGAAYAPSAEFLSDAPARRFRLRDGNSQEEMWQRMSGEPSMDPATTSGVHIPDLTLRYRVLID
jgi:hypothetical protein